MPDRAVGDVLVLAPTGRDADSASRLLAADHIPCRVYATLGDLVAALGDDAAGVLVADEALADRAALDAALGWLARQEAWSDLPFIILTRPGLEGARSARTAMLAAQLGNVMFLERPLSAITLVSAVRSMLRARARQRQVRAHLAESEREARRFAESEARLAMATDAAELGVWEADLVTRQVSHSPRTLQILGFGPEAATTPFPSWRERIHREDRDAVLEAAAGIAEDRAERCNASFRFERPDGTWIWVEIHGRVAARDPESGKPLRITGTCQDITARKASEERLHLLAREVDHRAKNALAVAQSLVRLSASENAQEYAKTVTGRIETLARAHTLLANDRWSGADLRALLLEELAAFQMGGRIRMCGPPVQLVPEAVQPLSMAVHELATNAAKYGSLSVPGGTLRIHWAWSADGESLGVTWQERGGPLIRTSPDPQGFGSTLIDSMVRGALEGGADFLWHEEGLECRIRISSRMVKGAPVPVPAASA